MIKRAQDSQTIVALATAPGLSGVAIVRLSGPEALHVYSKITRINRAPVSHKMHFTGFWNAEGVQLDQGLAVFFEGQRSFTGEDTIEFHTHGNPLIFGELIKACQVFGARLADPGEFSFRAVMNGKMDLTQAQALLQLIHRQSIYQLQSSLNQ